MFSEETIYGPGVLCRDFVTDQGDEGFVVVLDGAITGARTWEGDCWSAEGFDPLVTPREAA